MRLFAFALICVVFISATSHAVVRIWTGLSGASGNWNVAANWDGGVSAPTPGDDLVFPAGASRLTNTNNFPIGTDFNSITFGGTGYTLRGNRVQLAGNGVSFPGDPPDIISATTVTSTNNIQFEILIAKTNGSVGIAIGNSNQNRLNLSEDIFFVFNPLLIFESGRIDHFGTISGIGNIQVYIASDTYFDGAANNTYDGYTATSGDLFLDKSGGNAIPGDIELSAPSFFPLPGNITWLRSNQIYDFSDADFWGTLDLNGFGDTIGDLTGLIATTINGGTLSLNGDLSGSGNIFDTNYPPLLISGTGALGFNPGNHSIIQTTVVSDIDLNLRVTGSGNVTKIGTNILYLTASNDFSGTFTVAQGSVVASNNYSLGSTAGSTVVSNGAILVLSGGLSIPNEPLVLHDHAILRRRGSGAVSYSGPINLPGPGFSASITNPAGADFFLGGAISGSGGLYLTGAGTVIITGSTANTLSETLTVENGTLVLRKSGGAAAISDQLYIGDGNPVDLIETVHSAAPNQIDDSASVVVAVGSLWMLNGWSETIGRLSANFASDGGTVNLGGATLSIGAANSQFSFAGIITSSGGVTKIGTALGSLSGDNDYTGTTLVQAGTLFIEGSQPSSPVQILAGAKLTGFGKVGTVRTVANGTYTPGYVGINGANTMTSSNLALLGSSFLHIPIWGSGTGQYSKASVIGTVGITNAILDLVPQLALAPGDSFTIIENDGGDAVGGTFAGLPGGDFVGFGGLLWNIQYGNDVILTLLSQGLTNQPPGGGEDYLDLLVSGGNGDNYVDPNECVQLYIPLYNDTDETNPVVKVTLSSPHPGLLVHQAFSLYPELLPGAGAYNLTPYQISVPTNFQCGTNLPLVLTIKTGTNAPYALPIKLPTGKPGVEITYDSANPPLEIPDEGGTTDLVFVPGFTGHLAAAEISLYIDHPDVSQLKLTLIASDGTEIPLTWNSLTGSDLGADCNVTNRARFAYNSTQFVGHASAPYVGTFRPAGLLNLVRGMHEDDVAGRWYLDMQDLVAGDVGTNYCWSMHLYPAVCDDGGGICDLCPAPVHAEIIGTDPVTFVRVARVDSNAPPTTCSDDPALDYLGSAGTYNYHAYTYYNQNSNETCISVTLTTECFGAAAILSSAHLGGYGPADVTTNVLGFIGYDPDPSTAERTYSFLAPGYAEITIVVTTVNSFEGCKGYYLRVDGPDICSVKLFISPGESDKVELDWSNAAIGFELERSPEMLPTNWQLVPDEPSVVDSRFVVTNGAASAEAYYRLRKP